FFGEDFIGSLPVQFVSIFEPPIGVDPFSGPTRAAFRVAIPPSYQGLNPVTLRLFLRRDSQTPPVAGSLEFNIFGKRLIDASGTFDDYLNPAGRNVTVDPSVSAAEFKLIDLPLNTSPDGLGGGPLAAGQFLAFEIGATADDGASYILLGAELYETETAPPVSGATINP
ncbi:MAG: hypothetical protein O7F76_04105, partial [Planctomycetota bacterium]|nr:hypothetical protein [Planctomycetota bacterium]